MFAFLFHGIDDTARQMIALMKNLGNWTHVDPQIENVLGIYRSRALRSQIGVHNLCRSIVVYFRDLGQLSNEMAAELFSRERHCQLLVRTLVDAGLLVHHANNSPSPPPPENDESQDEDDEDHYDSDIDGDNTSNYGNLNIF